MDGDQMNGLAAARDLGRASRLDDASGRYIEAVKTPSPKAYGWTG